MARKRRAISPAPPPPPPPPPQHSSSGEESDSDAEEEEQVSPRAAAVEMPAQNAAAEEQSRPDADAQAYQKQPVARSTAKPAASASELESDADEEDDGESSESDPEVAKPVPKKALTTKKSKTVAPKRPEVRSPAKSAAAASQLESDDEEEEDGDSSESEPEVPEPVPKKAASTKKSKTVAPERPEVRSPAKPAAAASQLESDADEEEDGESSESDPEIPEPVPKKAAATKKSKTMAPERPEVRSPAKPAAAASQLESDADEEEDGQSSESDPEVPEPVPKKAAATRKSKTLAPERPAVRSPAKPAAAASQLDSDADEEEDGETSESDPEVPEPVLKKAAVTSKSKTVAQDKKKGPAQEPAPSGNSKKAKVDAGNVVPEATAIGKRKKSPAPETAPSGNSKKTRVEAGKVVPEATPNGKGKKAKVLQGKATREPTASGKGKRPRGTTENPSLFKSPGHRLWSNEDSIMILQALADHVEKEAVLMKAEQLLAAVGGRLNRKNCNKTDIYEKVRSLKKRYQRLVNGGKLPTGGDELKMHNLSEAIWGQEAEVDIAAAASQKGSSVAKRKKGQAVEVETDRNAKRKLLKEGNATATPNGDTLAKGKVGKTVKEASTGKQNGGSGSEKETHQEDVERAAYVEGTHKSHDEMQNMYPNLARCVERITAKHPCKETMRMAFGSIGDEKARALESKMLAERKSEAKTQSKLYGLKKEALQQLLYLMD